ncbi:hypothetical protein EVAR_45856_1 [Eumeta japonica]|uniref:Uncharacterized protein n=1 Tax=Eumeta variegata TaxID=151549 RepID=A0A4C1WPH4_EUMVA|nr:hypothetical protein EVAR_45856_1 [Eumeta japonica]
MSMVRHALGQFLYFKLVNERRACMNRLRDVSEAREICKDRTMRKSIVSLLLWAMGKATHIYDVYRSVRAQIGSGRGVVHTNVVEVFVKPSVSLLPAITNGGQVNHIQNAFFSAHNPRGRAAVGGRRAAGGGRRAAGGGGGARSTCALSTPQVVLFLMAAIARSSRPCAPPSFHLKLRSGSVIRSKTFDVKLPDRSNPNCGRNDNDDSYRGRRVKPSVADVAIESVPAAISCPRGRISARPSPVKLRI